jgi:ATP-dependent helicase/nuclease subunit A
VSLTDRQRRAVRAAGGVAITAGAGTGKTHTLGHRYLAHLEEGLSPLEVVAVTFTERAAHELRARVRAYARAAFSPDDPRLAELEAAPIGTVHALCLRICRDHPEAAGLPPDVRILDPLEGEVWWAERLEHALGRLPAELFSALPYERVRDALAVLLRDPYRAERALAHGPEHWSVQVEEAREAARRERLETPELRAAEATLAGLAARPDGDAGERARRDVLAALNAARSGDADAAADRIHRRSARVGAKGAWGGDQDALREALAVALEALRAWLDDPRATLALGPADEVLAELLPHLRAGFETAREALAADKRRAGVLDFADVEVAALRALGAERVREHYRARWSALLVDEVQDTSPVQEAILGVLADFCRTTVVGDVKQSIYGFRGADAEVFRRLARRVEEEGGEAVGLDLSFRTHASLVAAANRAFETLLGDDHEPLEAFAADAPSSAPPLRWWTLEAPKGVPSGLRRLAEAHRIADEILARIEEGTPVRDERAPGGTRPIRPGDVAVLARAWAPLDLLAEILPARGVPAVHTGGGDLLGTREAQDGIAALRALADPHDDVALVALLRGPAFAVSDADLERFADEALRPGAAHDRPPTWWRALREHRPAWARCALSVLEELVEAALHDTPSRLLQRLDRATGWSAVVANLPGGPRRMADLVGFQDLVRELERGSGDVFGVARRIRRLQRAGATVDRPALEAEDAVTLTTVHRSKGLEWPMVVVAALDAGSRPGGLPLRMRPELGVAVQVEIEHEARARPVAWTLLELADRAAEEAEDRRLLYVALTRAADLVAVSSAGGTGRYLDLLAPGLEQAGVAPETRSFDPEEARWPEPPIPRAAARDGHAPDGHAPHDARDGAPGPTHDAAADVPGAAEALRWRSARAWVEAIAPEAVELVDALAAAGAPAPQPGGGARPSRLGEAGRPLLRWHAPAGPVMLLEPGSPGGDGVRRIAVDGPDPGETVARLLAALGSR